MPRGVFVTWLGRHNFLAGGVQRHPWGTGCPSRPARVNSKGVSNVLHQGTCSSTADAFYLGLAPETNVWISSANAMVPRVGVTLKSVSGGGGYLGRFLWEHLRWWGPNKRALRGGGVDGSRLRRAGSLGCELPKESAILFPFLR